MNTLQTVLLLVLVGVVVLDYLKIKRYFVFFLVRTRHGLSLLDWLASAFPRFWSFWADAAVLISFGGLGGAYLAKHRHQRNLYGLLFFVGVAAIALARPTWFWGFTLCVGLADALIVLSRWGNARTAFVSTAFVSYLLLSNFFTVNYVSAVTSVLGAPALLLTGLTKNAIDIVWGGSKMPGVSPLLPGSRGGSKGVIFPGYNIFVPWWFALIAIIVTLLSHEMAHGIIARLHNIKVKSAGILTAGLLPLGAFVEPDDEEIKRSRSLTKVRVFAAGSFANLIVGGLAFAAIVGAGVFVSSVMTSDGMEVVGVVDGYPAQGVLQVGDVITAVNGEPTANLSSFREATEPVRPGENISISTSRGDFVLNTTSFPNQESKAYVGIEMLPHQDFTPAFREKYGVILPIALFLILSLYWIFFFNVNIALVNLLPIFPFDGGRILVEFVRSFDVGKIAGKKIAGEVIMAGVLLFTLILFAVNAYPLLGLASH